MIKTFESLEGWEDIIDTAGLRWLAFVQEERNGELLCEPCYQILNQAAFGAIAVPEMNPMTKAPSIRIMKHVEVDATFFTPLGCDMPCPPRRFNGWSSRSLLTYFPVPLQEQLRTAINGQIRRTATDVRDEKKRTILDA